MAEWMEIGVFGVAEEGTPRLSKPLYVQKHRIRSGVQTITVTVTSVPALAGLDPFRLLDVVVSERDDNVQPVQARRGSAVAR